MQTKINSPALSPACLPVRTDWCCCGALSKKLMLGGDGGRTRAVGGTGGSDLRRPLLPGEAACFDRDGDLPATAPATVTAPAPSANGLPAGATATASGANGLAVAVVEAVGAAAVAAGLAAVDTLGGTAAGLAPAAAAVTAVASPSRSVAALTALSPAATASTTVTGSSSWGKASGPPEWCGLICCASPLPGRASEAVGVCRELGVAADGAAAGVGAAPSSSFNSATHSWRSAGSRSIGSAPWVSRKLLQCGSCCKGCREG